MNTEEHIKTTLNSYFEVVSIPDWGVSSRGDDWLDDIWRKVILPFTEKLDDPLKYFIMFEPNYTKDYCLRYVMSKDLTSEEIQNFLKILEKYSNSEGKVNEENYEDFCYYDLNFHL